jgi:aspartyl-tRNA(Asn)/glutamyl-tRNA(Gln) amidotransferase subunit A
MPQVSSRDRLEQALSRIADPKGEGSRACLTVYAETARAAADAADARARSGTPLGPLDGAIVTIKDLFDVAGEVTRAGSKVLLAEGKVAAADAPAVARLRAAGCVIVAKTNMTEFAFSGVGLNPHFGTPGNPKDRSRIPGGSTSGGAVAVADGMCEVAIGSDTGGSTRIPAALCGIVGWKPSKQRVPTEGAFPLSSTLDSIGPMARTVVDCARADAVMAGEKWQELEPATLKWLRIGILRGMPFANLDSVVEAAVSGFMTRIGKAGVRFSDETIPLLNDMNAINAKGGFSPAEAYAVHRERLKTRGQDIDPNVRMRIERGSTITPEVYAEMIAERARLVRAMDERLADVDALVMPTTAICAPKMSEVATPETFSHKNMLLLRNPALVNFFDLCAISLPILGTALPVGLMLVARNGHDRKLFNIAAAVEQLYVKRLRDELD